MTAYRTRSAARSDVGLVRKLNEDSMLVRDEAALWIVADGMGGHDNGDWASQTLAGQFAAADMSGDRTARGAALIDALTRGNATVHDAAQAAGKQMGTTLVLIHIDDDDALCLWVGDSRIYRSRNGELTQISRDHSVVQDLVDRGLLNADEAELHPMSHVLSRAVGVAEQAVHDSVIDKARPGDHYLLCSDGLTKVVPEEVIGRMLGRGNIEAAADALIAETLERGAPDNVTLVIVAIDEATALIGMPA